MIHRLEWGREIEMGQIENQALSPVFHLIFFLSTCYTMVNGKSIAKSHVVDIITLI